MRVSLLSLVFVACTLSCEGETADSSATEGGACDTPAAEGEACEYLADDPCEGDLVCYAYTDAFQGCDGTCRPVGSECEVDTDCVEAGTGDLCVYGYCETCCPG